MAANKAGYEAIRDEAIRVGCPKLWASDLEVDRGALEAEDAPRTFIWALREAGTHLIYSNAQYTSVNAVARAFAHTTVLWYYYDGTKLHSITEPEARGVALGTWGGGK